ncbi:hypothetical protein Taro_015140 [Colocasia esculenta]|uniref:Uncharacterized protein n=1 Tax=Colocasia esculenta TaxID=4460 RepID=A0A843UKL2_COLES|nr:hypothetical protein [Colocasia esculenta]
MKPARFSTDALDRTAIRPGTEARTRRRGVRGCEVDKPVKGHRHRTAASWLQGSGSFGNTIDVEGLYQKGCPFSPRLPPPNPINQRGAAAAASAAAAEQTNKQKVSRQQATSDQEPQRQQTRMGSRGHLLLRLVLLAAVALAALSGARAGEQLQPDLADQLMGWIPTRSACKGTIAECLAGEEFALDSESNRRILATTGYISYAALRRGSVPCSRRGASYYNCRAGAQANPYSRGCSAITRCRS